MTNKPMLSVERDLIERAVQAIINTSQMQPALNDLRALLDDPAKDYVLINGMYFSHAEILEWREKACADMEKAAQHQGEPVAWVECSPAWLKAGGDCATAPRICVGREGISHLHPAHSNAEQPAPVAVADFYEAFRFSEIVTDDQAGELAEIAARLNGVKP